MKKILITGGTGYLGRNLANFYKKKYKVFLGARNNKQNFLVKNLTNCEVVPLDVSNIDLRLKGVQILVVGPTGKTIVNFGVKEGERKALAGKVSFADVEPVDLANYPAFEEK